MKHKVLAASWHPGGMNAIVPVIRRISEENKARVVTIGHQYSEKILNDAGLDYKKISDYGIADVSESSMERLLEAECPDLVLTGTSSPDNDSGDVIEQTLTLAARRKGIKTLAVLDFWADYSKRFSDVHSNEKFKFLPDKVAIMDEYARQAMLGEGFESKGLVITGNPHFDDLESKAREFSSQNRRELREKLGLNDELIVLYAGTLWKKHKLSFGYWDLDDIKLVSETIAQLPKEKQQEVRFLVKLHPRTPEEDIAEISDYLKNSGSMVKLAQGIGPHQAILASDITLTANSTVAIEAVYMHKPCISLQPGLKGEDFLSVLTNNSIIPVGYTTGQCKELVRKAILDDSYRTKEMVERASEFRSDGKATERVTSLVYRMLESYASQKHCA
jgi:hypothetical protein